MAETVISDFQAGHAWVKSGLPGTISDDLVTYKFGSQSLKLVTDGAAGESRIRWTGVSPAIDMTGKFFVLWVRIDDITNINRLWLYAFSTAWTAGYTWKPSDAPSHWLDSAGAGHGSNATWIPLSFSFGAATITGAPNRAAITNFQLYAQDKNATAVTINWGGLHKVDQEGNPVMTFTFDDCWESIYSEGYSYLSSKGFPGVSYLTSDELGDPARMTQANIDTMYGAGWDIAGHYQTELDAVPDVDATLQYIQAYLIAQGYDRGLNEIALPGGVWNETSVIPAVKNYFRTCRTIVPYNETRPPGDPGKLRVLGVFNTTPVATITGRIDTAITNNEWLILVFHKIVAVPATSIEYSIDDFQSVVDYAEASGIDVASITDIMPYTLVPLSGTLTPTGNVNRKTSISKSGSITPTGALSWHYRQLVSLAGSITPTGAFAAIRCQKLDGGLTPTGALGRNIFINSLRGSMQPYSVVGRKIIVTRTGSITPTGALAWHFVQLMTGALTYVGALAHKPLMHFTGSLTSAGELGLTVRKSFVGVMTNTGSLGLRILKGLSGSMTPTGNAGIKTKLQLDGSMTPTASMVHKVLITLIGSMTNTGNLAQKPKMNPTGSLTPTGALTKKPKKNLSGSMTNTGSLAVKPLVALGGALSFVGALAQKPLINLTGSLTSVGVLTRNFKIALSGSMTNTGALGRKVYYSLSGAMTNTGALGIKFKMALSGSLTPTGALTMIKRFIVHLSGSLTMTGTIAKKAKSFLILFIHPRTITLKPKDPGDDT